jgi:sulfite reductase alpha subunit-like flavoprotein
VDDFSASVLEYHADFTRRAESKAEKSMVQQKTKLLSLLGKDLGEATRKSTTRETTLPLQDIQTSLLKMAQTKPKQVDIEKQLQSSSSNVVQTHFDATATFNPKSPFKSLAKRTSYSDPLVRSWSSSESFITTLTLKVIEL